MRNKVTILLSLIFTLYSLYGYAFDKCSQVIESLKNCEKKSCTANINGNIIEYEIIRLKEKGNCKFFERDLSGVTICYVSDNEVDFVSDYLKKLLNNNYNKMETDEIVKYRFNKCHFYKKTDNELVTEEMGIKKYNTDKVDYIAELKRRKNKANAIKSIFFDAEVINNLKEVSHNIKDNEYKTQSKLPALFRGNKVSLDSIIYLSSDKWKIWVNGELFENYSNLYVTSVTKDSATFVWKVHEQIDKDTIEFTLYVGQVFDLDSELIKR